MQTNRLGIVKTHRQYDVPLLNNTGSSSDQLRRWRADLWGRHLMIGCRWWGSCCRVHHDRSLVHRGASRWWLHPALRRRQHVLRWWRETLAGVGVRRWWHLLLRRGRHLRRCPGAAVVPRCVLSWRSLRWLPWSQRLCGHEGSVSTWSSTRGHRWRCKPRSALSYQHCTIILTFLLGHVTGTDPHHHTDVQSQLYDPHCHCKERRHLCICNPQLAINVTVILQISTISTLTLSI